MENWRYIMLKRVHWSIRLLFWIRGLFLPILYGRPIIVGSLLVSRISILIRKYISQRLMVRWNRSMSVCIRAETGVRYGVLVDPISLLYPKGIMQMMIYGLFCLV